MNDKFVIGQFGKFEWVREVKEKIDGETVIHRYPYSIEGAQIRDIDNHYLYLVDMIDVPYFAPKKETKYTPMEVKKAVPADSGS